MWAIINQFQLYILLLLTGAYIPGNVKKYLSGIEIILFDFDFIPLLDLPLLDELKRFLDFDQSSEMLKDIDIESGSSVINNICFFLFMILFFTIHLST